MIRQKKYYTDKSYAYIMPRERSIDIDFIDDFKYAEFLMSNSKDKNELKFYILSDRMMLYFIILFFRRIMKLFSPD